MVLGVMKEDKKLGGWKESKDGSLTHVPLGPVCCSDMVSKVGVFFLGRKGKQNRVSFDYRLRAGDERWPFVDCRCAGGFIKYWSSGSPLGLRAVGKL